MPATYTGNAANNTTATPWQSLHAYSLGALISASSASIGQVWICTVAGTSGASQPAAFFTAATLGTVVSDGATVKWTLYGSEPVPRVAPIIQVPVDTDPPLSFPFVIPMKTMADVIAYLQANAALTILGSGVVNNFLGLNTFNLQTSFSDNEGETASDATMLVGTPTVTTRKPLVQFFATSNNLYDGFYLTATGNLELVINALWNAGNWLILNSSIDCMKVVFGPDGITTYGVPGSTSSPFNDSAWVQSSTIAAQDGVSYLRQVYTTSGIQSQQGAQIIGVQMVAGYLCLVSPPVNSAGFGKQIIVKDELGTAAAHNITIEVPVGYFLDGVANGTKTLNTNYQAMRFYWSDATHLWSA